ncbi:hypothetical protein Ahy_A05g023139 [Arachis hypogaea]|uniref:Uncharacterized protein n=1 Tax=Arachis hypogaea TaxID=3818 RepID=A0A445D328_ARAHY|nr:hypothetical protein Ahy_A05g023139 [Arachis hypogaea]
MLRVTHCDRRASVFSVEEMESVDGWSQTSYRIPCAAASIEWGHFVDPVYTMISVFKVYETEFSPISDEKMWPPWYGARL